MGSLHHKLGSGEHKASSKSYMWLLPLHLVLLNSPAVTILVKQAHIFKPHQDLKGRVDEMPRGAHHICFS